MHGTFLRSCLPGSRPARIAASWSCSELPVGGDDLVPFSRQTAYGQIADAIRADILAGAYEPSPTTPPVTNFYRAPPNLAASTA